MNFLTKLDKVITNNDSLLCVGLDPDINKIPPHIASQKDAFFIFNKAIIDATSNLVCAYKP
ncbi:MAG: orotidine-5-phosphate decarboxylase, partial [Patescibacteria group bacterium]|nr:orotidine-5-phosphate decarboxylase [Patescibacteria group bacterium]